MHLAYKTAFSISKWDGSIVYAKNSVLTTQYIINVRRSGRTGEVIGKEKY